MVVTLNIAYGFLFTSSMTQGKQNSMTGATQSQFNSFLIARWIKQYTTRDGEKRLMNV